jgi:hypothetical protein
MTKRTHAMRDMIGLGIFLGLTLAASILIDPFARAVAWIYHHDNWELDGAFTFVLALAVGLAVYAWRRSRDLRAEMREREQAQETNKALTATLETTLTEVRTLRGVLRICESCNRILDASHSWISLELFIQAESKARFSHGLCPDCARKAYGRETHIVRH